MSFTWRTAAPEDHGLDATKLEVLQSGLADKGTKALLIVRNDHIVHEWYLDDRVRTRGHYIASMAKALVGGVCLSLGIDDGVIDLDDPAAKFVPQWAVDPRKSKITIRQLGSHTSGMAESKPKDQGGWQQTFWELLEPPNDPFTISRDLVPIIHEPGSQDLYSNPGIAMFGYALTVALKQDLRTALRDRVLLPIGVSNDEWSCGYDQTFNVEGLPMVAAWGGGSFTARASARLGRLMLREGDWDGQRLIGTDAVRRAISSAGTPNGAGQGWWTNNFGRYDRMPGDAYFAAGAEHQTVLIIPSLDLICVRNGAALGPPNASDPRGPCLIDPLMRAIIA